MTVIELRLTGKNARQHNLVALIDEADAQLVSGHTWNAQKFKSAEGRYYFYAGCRINGKTVLLHRFLTGAIRGQKVDHRDHNTLNDTRENLRVCTHAENMRNRCLNSNSSTGVKGVWHDHKNQCFRAYIRVDGRRIFLGRFKRLDLAGKAYRDAAVKYHGEFANFG